MLTKIIFVSSAITIGGRRGRTKSASGLIDLDLDSPKELGGQAQGSNPEELFACGYSACFGGTLEFLMRQKSLAEIKSQVTAKVFFGNDSSGGYGIAVEMNIFLPGITAEGARTLVQEAHGICPYSKAISGNVQVTFNISV